MRVETIQDMAMVPVRGTVYVFKLPFVLVWKVVLFLYACVYAVVAAVVSVPVYYAKKVYNRIIFVWKWTKLSVRQTLGFSNSPPAITDVPPTVQTNRYLSEVPANHPLSIDSEDPFDHPPPYGVYRRPGHGKRSKTSRKALISHLIRLLLEPNSPAESEDEIERPSRAMQVPPERDDAEKALSLILDLMKLSKASGKDSRGQDKQEPKLQPQELASLLRQTKDKEMLQALITELDQLTIDVDPATLQKRRSKKSSFRASQDSPSPSHVRLDSERASSAASSVDTLYTPNPSSTVSSSDEYTEPTVGEYDYEEQEDDMTERQPYKHGTLSPVQESPEYLSASSESLSYNQLEHDLNKALTKLTTEANGLNADPAALDSLETEIIQKTVTVTEGIPVNNNQVQEDDFSSVPKTAPVLGLQVGHDRKNLANARKTRPPTRKVGLNEKQVSPTDGGLDNKSQEGGTKQDQEDNLDDYEDDQSDDSEYEEATNDDNDENKWEDTPGNHGKKIPGGVRVLPPLKLMDQIHLLTAGSPTWQTACSDDGTELDNQSETTDLSQACTSDKKLETDPQNEERKRNASDPSPMVPSTLGLRRGSTSSDVGSEASKEKKSLIITSSQPPWIEMVERRKRTTSSNSSSSATTPTHPTSAGFPIVIYRPPNKSSKSNPAPQDDTPVTSQEIETGKSKVSQPQASDVALSKPNIWDNNDDDITEGIYDTLIPKSATTDCLYDKLPPQPKYLHEKIAARTSGVSSVEPSPKLPPRNLALKRTSSAEAVTQEVLVRRRGSEDYSVSTHVSRSAEKEPRKSRSREKEPREKRSRDKEPRESRSKDKERHERHRSGSSSGRHRSHSAERRSGSRTGHSHSSDRHHHRSRSGDRSSSHSTERHSSTSSHHRSSAEKHRSHSTDKTSSRSSSEKSSSKSSDQKWRVLSSPSTSRSRLATALFSRSSVKESSSTKTTSDKEGAERKRSSSVKEKEKDKSSSKSSDSKSKSVSSKSKSTSSSSKSSKSKSSDTTPEKTSSRRTASASGSPDKDESPEVKGAVARSTSMSSIRSAGACSVYSFDSASYSGKQTEI